MAAHMVRVHVHVYRVPAYHSSLLCGCVRVGCVHVGCMRNDLGACTAGGAHRTLPHVRF